MNVVSVQSRIRVANVVTFEFERMQEVVYKSRVVVFKIFAPQSRVVRPNMVCRRNE